MISTTITQLTSHSFNEQIASHYCHFSKLSLIDENELIEDT